MKYCIIFSKLNILNANSLTDLTWGFPSISAFLGFGKRIERELKFNNGYNFNFNGIGIVSHYTNQRTYKDQGKTRFIQSKNPFQYEYQKQDKGAPIIEEGKLDCVVSLLLEVEIKTNSSDELHEIEDKVNLLAQKFRIAGGDIDIHKWRNPEIIPYPLNTDDLSKFHKGIFKKLMPGFALCSRTEFLKSKIEEVDDPLKAFMEFGAIKYREKVEIDKKGKYKVIERTYVPRDYRGWLVPIHVGYYPISEKFKPGEIKGARDSTTPFIFVEPIFSIGEWISPHRIKSISDIIWRYSIKKNIEDKEFYLFENSNQNWED